MYKFLEFVFYTIMAVIFYRNFYKEQAKLPGFKKMKMDDDLISAYNNVLDQYKYNEISYTKLCKSFNNPNTTIIFNDKYIYEGDTLYGRKHGCGKMMYINNLVYEGIWENDTIHGFGTLYDDEFSISGYKKNNNYHGLVKISGDKFSNSSIKNIDCIYDNGIQKFCFVINDQQNIHFVIPENIHVVF